MGFLKCLDYVNAKVSKKQGSNWRSKKHVAGVSTAITDVISELGRLLVQETKARWKHIQFVTQTKEIPKIPAPFKSISHHSNPLVSWQRPFQFEWENSSLCTHYRWFSIPSYNSSYGFWPKIVPQILKYPQVKESLRLLKHSPCDFMLTVKDWSTME